MLPHLLTNFETQKCYQNEPEFNGVYSRNNLPKIKNGPYIINFDEFKSIGTHWIALYVNGNNRRATYDAIYFDSFGVGHIPEEIKKLTGNKNIINIYGIQACNLIMCWYFCIEFIDFMLKGISMVDCTNLFSPSEYEKNNKVILKYFQ